METVVIEPEAVKAQREPFEQSGEERTLELDLMQPKLFKCEIIRPKYWVEADRMQPPMEAEAAQAAPPLFARLNLRFERSGAVWSE